MTAENGAKNVSIDNGTLVDQVMQTEGFNEMLEMVGVADMRDSLQRVEEGGTGCLVGSVNGKWAFEDDFSPMISIPTAVSLTAYPTSAKVLKRFRWTRKSSNLGREESHA